MLVNNPLTSDIKPNILSIEKNINKILNEIKSFNSKSSHQKILNILKEAASNPTIFKMQNSKKNIQAFKNIYTKLQNIEFYKNNPKEFKNIQKEIKIIFQKYYDKNSLKKDIMDIKNELRNFSPQKSPQKIMKLISNLTEKFSKLPTITESQEKLSNTPLNNIKIDINNILNKLDNIDFYKNNPNTLQSLKNQLSSLIKDKPYFLSQENKQLIQNLYQKSIMLLAAEKNTSHVEKLVKNIENILNKDNTQVNIQSELKSIKNNFEQIKINLSNNKNIKNLLISMQKDIQILVKNLKNAPKHKEFNSFIKDTILQFNTNKIKILNQNQIIKNIGNITKNIDKIISTLPKDKKYTPIKEELSKFYQDIKQIDLKQNIKNSGILFESKLLKSIDDKKSFIQIAKHDVKAILLSLKDDANLKKYPQLQNSIENTLSQINAVQINALLGQSFTSYIPFAWDNLKNGYFSIAKLKKENSFSCKIELDLNKYGKIDILMLFHLELLSIKMDIKNKEFENILKKESSLLQQSLKKIGFDTSIFFAKKLQNSYIYENSFNNSLDMDLKA